MQLDICGCCADGFQLTVNFILEIWRRILIMRNRILISSTKYAKGCGMLFQSAKRHHGITHGMLVTCRQILEVRWKTLPCCDVFMPRSYKTLTTAYFELFKQPHPLPYVCWTCAAKRFHRDLQTWRLATNCPAKTAGRSKTFRLFQLEIDMSKAPRQLIFTCTLKRVFEEQRYQQLLKNNLSELNSNINTLCGNTCVDLYRQFSDIRRTLIGN